jgi:hypothetical protein
MVVEDNIKIYSRELVYGETNNIQLAQGPVVSFYKHKNETLGFIQARSFMAYFPFKEFCVVWSL